MKKLYSIKLLKVIRSSSIMVTASVLLQACQSNPVERSDHCEHPSCDSCDKNCDVAVIFDNNDRLTRPDSTPKPDVNSDLSGSRKHKSKTTPLICTNASRFEHQVVGNGHCVSLIQACSEAPTTKQWRPGELVSNTTPLPGTVIATFVGGKYPSRKGYHAAVYISQDQRGIWVWDQWIGKPVHKRQIKFASKSKDASNSAQRYRVVELNVPRLKNTN